jgi:hypothetical protein
VGLVTFLHDREPLDAVFERLELFQQVAAEDESFGEFHGPLRRRGLRVD